MQQRLRQVLNGLATPEQIQLLCEACEVLEELNFRDHEFAIEQLISKPDMVPGELAFQLIEDVFKPTFAEYLQAMGVKLVEDATLSQYKSALFWISRIENFEDQEAINGIASSDESSEDNLAEILSVVSAEPSDNFILMFDSVSDALLTRIAELSEGKEVPVLVDVSEFNRAKARTVKYFDWLMERVPEFVGKYIKPDDLKLGLPAEVILASHREVLEDLPDGDCAKLLIFYLFTSDLPDEAVKPAIANEVEVLFSDIIRAMGVSKQCQVLLGQLNHA